MWQLFRTLETMLLPVPPPFGATVGTLLRLATSLFCGVRGLCPGVAVKARHGYVRHFLFHQRATVTSSLWTVSRLKVLSSVVTLTMRRIRLAQRAWKA